MKTKIFNGTGKYKTLSHTIIFFIMLFAWISFFPEPVQVKYGVYTKIFLGIFLFILILDKRIGKYLFSFRDWPLWLFVLSMSAGIICATDKNVAFKTYTYLAITLVTFFYIGKGLFIHQQDSDKVSLIICICSGLVALFGILEVIYACNPIYLYFIPNTFYERYIQHPVRPMSTQLNPAVLATYLLLTLPFVIHMVKQKRLVIKFLGYVFIVLDITCLILTFSRSSFLGLIFMLFSLQFILKKYEKLRIYVLFFLILLIAASFLPYPFNRFSLKGIGIFGTGIFSDYRLIRMQMSWEMLKHSHSLGVGLNHFRILFDQYYPIKAGLSYLPYEIKIADNMYLTLLAETGIIGLAGFLIFIVSLFKRGITFFYNSKDINSKQTVLIPVLALIGLMVSMGGYELFYWSNPFMFFCLICGFIAAKDNIRDNG
ncbi:MAG: O-antigen ligase family protein [Candidatus Omnitrophica bacterium]|nr:O-antigen ligase family protein [Candidatus Omnitrophota bacterium]